ncbi:hypothetical protein LuPra_01111 [Luteitalea pratensis]|uniref:Uncharacterized protein n=1 Tax=Luteitalea pratensis TaxID=1855912 RepID=A0A143PH91_LUTPR|nr:hypothetical protein LuPra_01111 [Luteitalea pratensis]
MRPDDEKLLLSSALSFAGWRRGFGESGAQP